MNKATKYAVTLATFVSVVTWPDRLLACWVLVGAVTNAFVNKALKYMLNHARPSSGLHAKTDPGMPSSHAQSLAYLAGYPAMGWLVRASLSPVSATVFLCLLGGQAVPRECARLRLREGTGADAGARRARPRHRAGAHRSGAGLAARALRPAHVATGVCERESERDRAPDPFFFKGDVVWKQRQAASGNTLTHAHAHATHGAGTGGAGGGRRHRRRLARRGRRYDAAGAEWPYGAFPRTSEVHV